MRKIKDPVKLVFEFILVGILFFIFYIALSYHNFYEKRADFTAKGTDFSNISNFLDITKIKANIKDAPITVIESNVSEITVSSTVKNRGIGIITSPKAWKSNGVLHFDQGYVIGHNEKSTGAVTIEVPMGMILDIDIKSGSGDVTVDISTSRNVFIDATVGEKTVKSKGDNILINSVSGNINIEDVFENTEKYFEENERYKAIFDIYADTVDGSIDVIDFNNF